MRIAIVNLKGGTGKTVTAVYLAAALAGLGRTLLVDADPRPFPGRRRRSNCRLPSSASRCATCTSVSTTSCQG